MSGDRWKIIKNVGIYRKKIEKAEKPMENISYCLKTEEKKKIKCSKKQSTKFQIVEKTSEKIKC